MATFQGEGGDGIHRVEILIENSYGNILISTMYIEYGGVAARDQPLSATCRATSCESITWSTVRVITSLQSFPQRRVRSPLFPGFPARGRWFIRCPLLAFPRLIPYLSVNAMLKSCARRLYQGEEFLEHDIE